MSRVAYFDCPAGASGDMLLGALVAAGWPIASLAAVVQMLGLAGVVTVASEPVRRGALAATRVQVTVTEAAPPQRQLPEILERIGASGLPATVVAAASAVFQRLAEAEASVHGQPVAAVHFHEVGAVDALVDIVGVAAGLEALAVDAVWCSPLPAGSGWVASAHGPLPLPAPATLALLARAGAPVAAPPAAVDLAGELVTPTGAALLTTLARFGRPALALEAVASGAGARDTPWPNVVRLWLGSALAEPEASVVQVETNIDDMVPELYGHVTERLFALGALDVWLTPVQMKQGRPGTLLGVLAPAALEDQVAALLLAETTTFGLRVQPVRRHVAERELRSVATAYGPIAIKLKLAGGQVLGYAPEYAACRAAAQVAGAPLARVYAAAQAAAARAIEEGAWTSG